MSPGSTVHLRLEPLGAGESAISLLRSRHYPRSTVGSMVTFNPCIEIRSEVGDSVRVKRQCHKHKSSVQYPLLGPTNIRAIGDDLDAVRLRVYRLQASRHVSSFSAKLQDPSCVFIHQTEKGVRRKANFAPDQVILRESDLCADAHSGT